METVLSIEKEIIDCQTKGAEYLTENEQNNIILDGISECTKDINNVNLSYIKLFDLLDKLSSFSGSEEDDEEGLKSVKEIMLILSEFATKTSVSFAALSRNELIQNGCKSALTDLRSNIRSLREYLEDVEESFFLKSETKELDSLVNDLI